MFANDTKQIMSCLYFINNLIVAPFQIAFTIFLIYLQVGVATFVGLGYMAVTAPLIGFFMSYITSFRKKKVEQTDKRVKLMNEVLGGIRVIKFYAWEGAFQKKVETVRHAEVGYLRIIAFISAIVFTLFVFSTPVILPVIVFYTYVKLGNDLDAATAFTTIALFNMLNMPFAFLPYGLVSFSQADVSVKRICNFLLSTELSDYVSAAPAISPGRTAISLKDVSAGWVPVGAATAEEQTSDPTSAVATQSLLHGDEEQGAETGISRSVHTLTDMTVEIERGQLVAVVGPVGAGKSSLLSAILGEMYLRKGTVSVATGSIAYCDQRPWILNATVEGNILFGAALDDDRLRKAIVAANLEEDLKVLPDGLQTEIGERGINLSGGQRARVALARAVYQDAACYLLDDPLSAVDAHVGQFLFDRCIRGALGGKTRVLVTHQAQLLSACDLVLVLADGRLQASGTYQQLREQGIDFAAASSSLGVVQAEVSAASSSEQDTHSEQSEQAADLKTDPKAAEAPPAKLITTEERASGNVDSDIYWHYLRAGGVWLGLLVVLALVCSQGCSLLASFYLTYWGEQTVRQEDNGHPMSGDTSLLYMRVYACIAVAAVFFLLCRSLLLSQIQLSASLYMHSRLLQRVLGAPVSFFDTTPIGRIINRFSSDLSTIDEMVPQTISQFTNSFFGCLGALVAIAIVTNGAFIVLMIPLTVIYNSIQLAFRKTNTAIARLEATSRSPIYADFSEALSGLSTIRAYKEQQRFVLKLEGAVDRNTAALVLQQLAGGWLGLRLDAIGAGITMFVAAFAVVCRDHLGSLVGDDFVSAGYLALGLSYSFTLTQYLKFMVRVLAQMEAQMNSVERVKDYSEQPEQEGQTGWSHFLSNGDDDHTSTAKAKKQRAEVAIPADWPRNGRIEARELQMRYRDGPLVIRDVSFSIAPQEKVGVAGRTGSGKSSLMNALFRIQELSSGQLLIDGVDLASVPLPLLRSRLGMIPQDAVMFSATVRFNIDPFELHSNDELWEILSAVDMKRHVMSLPQQLEEEVSEGGDNFSAGQRQLICIARALLRKPKILVLDEATASIDNETDELVQRLVRRTFKDCTVLTIAHRLHTIIDSDKILVLDQGRLLEMGPPQQLLAAGGAFQRLWERHQSSHHAV